MNSFSILLSICHFLVTIGDIFALLLILAVHLTSLVYLAYNSEEYHRDVEEIASSFHVPINND